MGTAEPHPGGAGHGPGDTATVLLVCRANVSRSPLGQRLLVQALERRAVSPHVQVLSAGTAVRPGMPMDPRMQRELISRGLGVGPFVSRSLREVNTAEVDLVLTATRAQRGVVLQHSPRLLRRTFTLRQAARLLGSSTGSSGRGQYDDPWSLTHLVSTLALLRGQQGPSAGVDDDIDDPYGRSEQTYRRVIDLVSESVEIVADALATGQTSTGPGASPV